MNLTISENEQNHVLIVVFLKLLTLCNGLFQKLGKVCGATEIRVFEYVSVLSHDLLSAIKIWIVYSSIDGKTMMNFIICVEVWMVYSGAKSVNRNQLIIIVV